MLWPARMAAMRRCLDRRGNRRVADALGQVDAADAVALRGHGADLRLHGAGRKLAQGKAGRRYADEAQEFGSREGSPTSIAILQSSAMPAHQCAPALRA